MTQKDSIRINTVSWNHVAVSRVGATSFLSVFSFRRPCVGLRFQQRHLVGSLGACDSWWEEMTLPTPHCANGFCEGGFWQNRLYSWQIVCFARNWVSFTHFWRLENSFSLEISSLFQWMAFQKKSQAFGSRTKTARRSGRAWSHGSWGGVAPKTSEKKQIKLVHPFAGFSRDEECIQISSCSMSSSNICKLFCSFDLLFDDKSWFRTCAWKWCDKALLNGFDDILVDSTTLSDLAWQEFLNQMNVNYGWSWWVILYFCQHS